MTGIAFGGFYIPRPADMDGARGEHPVERMRREFKERLRALKPGEPMVYGSRTHYYGGPLCTHDDRVWVLYGRAYEPLDVARALEGHKGEPGTAPEFVRCIGCGAWRVWGRASDYYPLGWRPATEAEPQ